MYWKTRDTIKVIFRVALLTSFRRRLALLSVVPTVTVMSVILSTFELPCLKSVSTFPFSCSVLSLANVQPIQFCSPEFCELSWRFRLAGISVCRVIDILLLRVDSTFLVTDFCPRYSGINDKTMVPQISRNTKPAQQSAIIVILVLFIKRFDGAEIGLECCLAKYIFV